MQSKKILTIFTPTYNRAYILNKLYESLKNQTKKDFVWLIVNDGSTDNTADLVSKWKEEGVIEIRYFYQNNAGKSQAYNVGINECDTELFSCVDSDDYLVDNAVEEIIQEYKDIDNNIGLVFMRKRENGSYISKWPKALEKAFLREAYGKYKASGDTMLIYKSEVMKNHSFPLFDREKFVPEAYLYDQLDDYGSLKFIHKAIYVCEYLPDGYTRGMARVIKENPQGYIAFIRQRLEKDKTLVDICEDTIRYDAIAICANEKRFIFKSRYPLIALLLYPAGLIFYLFRYRKD